jgi:signal transduction histidine kinase
MTVVARPRREPLLQSILKSPPEIDAYPHELAAAVAGRLREAREELIHRWLERIDARVNLEPEEIFDSADLLNHMPLLVEGVADYLMDPHASPEISGRLQNKAMELGALRHAQGFDAYEILKENDLFARIVFTRFGELIAEFGPEADAGKLFLCAMRIRESMEIIRQATMTHFLRLSSERVREREDRLRRFNVLVSHELKNRVGAIRGAAELLTEDWLELPQRQRFQRMIVENAVALQQTLENLVTISRIGSDARQKRNVLLPEIVAEAVRQLRQMADASHVDIEIAEQIPPVEVDAAGVELCLVNYISNSIKYSDRAKDVRWVRIDGQFRFPVGGRAGELTIVVADNGIGVPLEARPRLFEQFFRAHDDLASSVEGTGLGLSIVRQLVESLGGRAWAEFPEEGGARFLFSLPSRREDDAAAAGTRRPEGVLT